jgi:N-acetyl-anhydromuramyl-L-alanine amidase AmpD
VAAFRGNYGSRVNTPIDTVVVHTTEGSLASAVSWFAQDHSIFRGIDGKPMAPSSAHYVVGKDGLVVQSVAEGDCAFACGNLATNRRSISVECEGRCADPTMWTESLLEALAELCAGIARRHGVPVLRTSAGPGFCGHSDVPDPYHPGQRGGAGHHQDPGPHFPWVAFLDRLDAALAPAAVLLPPVA